MASRVRIEYVRFANAAKPGAVSPDLIAQVPAASELLDVAGASVQSSAAPAFQSFAGFAGGVYAKVTCLSGAVNFTMPGTNPVATETNSLRVEAGGSSPMVEISPGQKIAFIQAVDGDSDTGGTGGGGSLTPGRTSAAASAPVVVSNEDYQALTDILTQMTLAVTKLTSLNDSFTAVDADLPKPRIATIAESPLLTGKINQLAASTSIVLVDCGASEKGAVYELHLQIKNYATDVLVTLKVNGVAKKYFAADGDTKQLNIDLSFRSYAHLMSGAVAEDLTIDLSATCDCTGYWDYLQGAAV